MKKIQLRLYSYVIETLKKHYGTDEKRWWIEGIPVKIRTRCATAWEENNRKDREESNLYLIYYKNICINNWPLVKHVISLGEKDKENKKANTKWIGRLNDIRNITAHPERGVLDAEQVAFVNQCLAKIEKYFPVDSPPT